MYEEQPVHGGGSRMMYGAAAAILALVHFSLFVRTVSSERPLPVTLLNVEPPRQEPGRGSLPHVHKYKS